VQLETLDLRKGAVAERPSVFSSGASSEAHLSSLCSANNSPIPCMPLGIVGTSFPFCVSARLLGRASSRSETYGPGTLPDRGSLGIESETTQTGIDWAPAGSALLTRGSFEGGANPTNSGLFSRVRDCRKRRIACKLPHEEHQFSAIMATAACIYDHPAGAAAVGNSYDCGQHDKRSCVAAFSAQSAPT
jgi:hypothetical protein